MIYEAYLSLALELYPLYKSPLFSSIRSGTL